MDEIIIIVVIFQVCRNCRKIEVQKCCFSYCSCTQWRSIIEFFMIFLSDFFPARDHYGPRWVWSVQFFGVLPRKSNTCILIKSVLFGALLWNDRRTPGCISFSAWAIVLTCF